MWATSLGGSDRQHAVISSGTWCHKEAARSVAMPRGIPFLILLPAVALLVCAILRTPWKLVAWLFLLVPLVGDMAALLPPGRGGSILSMEFVKAVMVVYPFALISFGFCGPLVGSVAWYLAQASCAATRLKRGTLLGGGFVVGGLVGSAIMLILVLWTEGLHPGPPVNLQGELMGLGVVGLAAGCASGFLVAVYSKPTVQPARDGVA